MRKDPVVTRRQTEYRLNPKKYARDKKKEFSDHKKMVDRAVNNRYSGYRDEFICNDIPIGTGNL